MNQFTGREGGDAGDPTGGDPSRDQFGWGSEENFDSSGAVPKPSKFGRLKSAFRRDKGSADRDGGNTPERPDDDFDMDFSDEAIRRERQAGELEDVLAEISELPDEDELTLIASMNYPEGTYGKYGVVGEFKKVQDKLSSIARKIEDAPSDNVEIMIGQLQGAAKAFERVVGMWGDGMGHKPKFRVHRDVGRDMDESSMESDRRKAALREGGVKVDGLIDRIRSSRDSKKKAMEMVDAARASGKK